MAVRDISVTKSGLGPVRVMKTCWMMGEVVAIYIHKENHPAWRLSEAPRWIEDSVKGLGLT